MLTWPSGTKVFVCTRATDMRCGFDTLTDQVRRFLAEDPLSGQLFVFRSRWGDRIKVLYRDTDGYALWCKRLERGTFLFPVADASGDRRTISIDSAQLMKLLGGLPVEKVLLSASQGLQAKGSPSERSA